MKLEKWALIAEIIGAAAIVVSLIFVGLQIRDVSNATYADTYDRLVADQINWRMQLATSPQALEGWRWALGLEGAESPDPLEIQAGRLATTVIVQMWERAFFANRYGRLNDDEWNRFLLSICSPENHEVWVRADVNVSENSRIFSQEFLQFVSECSPDTSPFHLSR